MPSFRLLLAGFSRNRGERSPLTELGVLNQEVVKMMPTARYLSPSPPSPHLGVRSRTRRTDDPFDMHVLSGDDFQEGASELRRRKLDSVDVTV